MCDKPDKSFASYNMAKTSWHTISRRINLLILTVNSYQEGIKNTNLSWKLYEFLNEPIKLSKFNFLGGLFMKVVFIIWISLIFMGCGLILPTSSFVKPSGPNRYSIKVFEGRGEDIYLKWDNQMQQTCGSKKAVTINQTFVKNPQGLNYLQGLFQCKWCKVEERQGQQWSCLFLHITNRNS